MTASVFHIELRQFPHNFCRFNLSEPELRASVLVPWSRGERFEIGDRRWDPEQASLTVIEGPRLSMSELAMARGWGNATRAGKDVTERMLSAASAVSAVTEVPSREPATDSLAGELVSLLGQEPMPLLRAWQLALERHPDRTPSECLALAEDLLRR